MNVALYDYNHTVQKSTMQCSSLNITVNADGDVYAEIECDANEYYKGGIELDDTVELPYPSFLASNIFRIRKIDTDNETMTLTAYHITHDISYGYCSTPNSMNNVTLEEFVASLTYGNNAKIRNNRDITFSVFKHSNTDTRYSTKHDFTLPMKMCDKIMEHIKTIFGCNFVRFGKQIVLTYGTASDYFRSHFELPEYSAVFTEGRNIIDMSTSADNTEKISSVYPYAYVDKDGISTIVRASLVKPTGTTETNAILKRHLFWREYNTDLTLEEGQLWSDFENAVKQDITKQAQIEVDAKYDDTQNVSVETISLQNEKLFGGETVIVADKFTQCDYSARITSFSWNVITDTYENVEIGRTTLKLADLTKQKGTSTETSNNSSGSTSGTTASSVKQYRMKCRINTEVNATLDGYLIKAVHLPSNAGAYIRTALGDNPFMTYIQCAIYVDLSRVQPNVGVVFSGMNLLLSPQMAVSESEDFNTTEHFDLGMHFDSSFYYDEEQYPVIFNMYVSNYSDGTAQVVLMVKSVDTTQRLFLLDDNYQVYFDLPEVTI